MVTDEICLVFLGIGCEGGRENCISCYQCLCKCFYRSSLASASIFVCVCVCGDGDGESAGIATSKAILQTTKEFPDQLPFADGWRQQPRLNFDVSVLVPPVTQALTAK